MKLGLEIYDNVLTSDECRNIISSFENDTRKVQGTVGKNAVAQNVKRSTDLQCVFNHSEYEDYNKFLLPALDNCIDKFVEDYQILNQLSQWDITLGYNIQKYVDGEGYYALHCEYERIVPLRILAWMIYLNDAECGTEFPYQDLVVEAKAGRCVIWSAGWTHAHKGVTPNVGTKYIATGWYEMSVF